jgi:NAD(P)-dependent dehydrogenase (short-subunit alcohol dehydrogenase family)
LTNTINVVHFDKLRATSAKQTLPSRQTSSRPATLATVTMKPWTFDNIADQTGRVAIVTGANSGIGLETARMLVRKGAAVVLACRNPEKGMSALQQILDTKPAGTATLEALDLSDLDSVTTFAERFSATHRRLDLLINNAGVMVPPLSRTKQNHELQFGTNHLGHFALTARLLPLLQKTPGARVVVVSSTGQNIGKIDFDDLDWEKRPYNPWRAYGQSKLANMMFVLELQRRLTAAGSKIRVTAAHPGWTATDLGRTSFLVGRLINPLLAMKPEKGALPTLRAAVDPDAAGGSYWGPSGFRGMNGYPALAKISDRAKDETVAARLFDESELLTGVSFALPARPPALRAVG